FNAMYHKNPEVDLLVCGDFNDDPTDESVVRYLHATDDIAITRMAAEGGEERPPLLDLFLDKDRTRFGTHNYHNSWNIFDQILVSPGLLDDRGWTCLPDSVHTVNDRTTDRRGRPKEFGSPNNHVPLAERGWSDHFPVTVRLAVQGE